MRSSTGLLKRAATTARALALLLLAAVMEASAADGTGLDCPPSFYALADGSGVDIAPSDEGHLRWRRLDGTIGYLTSQGNGKWTSTLGWTERSDGKLVDLSQCSEGRIVFAGTPGRRMDLQTRETVFANDGARLSGRLVMPPGSQVVPIVVLVHGSEDSSAKRYYALQRMLPAQGVGVFVYDKRGTGDSGGVYTHDISQLARDAHRALQEAVALAGPRAGRVGYYGSSQGGWTAPAAALLGQADFVIVGYGLAASPRDEDRDALELDMTEHGFGPDQVKKAQEIGSAAQAIVRAHYQSGYAELHELLAKDKDQPWLRFVRGNITGVVLDTPEDDLRAQGPTMFAGLDLDYDPMPVLRSLQLPQLWILGEEDKATPYIRTYGRLMALKRAGHRISVVSYPHVEHGLYEFEMKGDERLDTRQPESLQQLFVAFAKGSPLAGTYGAAKVDR